ncbi:hypothetical protein [Salinicoccus roseus]|uniref:hypothetical protein n=1 Tax=Salinicoccus roseus TaxID=45670 RepID=UPI003568F5C6
MKEYKIIYKNGDSVIVRYAAENASELMQEINRKKDFSSLIFSNTTIYPSQVAEVKEV